MERHIGQARAGPGALPVMGTKRYGPTRRTLEREDLDGVHSI